jgi:hypothetical protein
MHLRFALSTGIISLSLALACSNDATHTGNTGGAANGGAANGGAANGGAAGSDPSTMTPDASAARGGSAEAAGGASDGSRLFIPDHIQVNNLSGEGKAVNVIASSLLPGANGPALYSALRNDGEVWACDGSVSFELFDQEGISVGAWVSALYSAELFRRSDDQGGLIACLGPGAIAMTAIVDLGRSIFIEDLGTVLYQLTYFDRDILPFELLPIDAISVTSVQVVDHDSGSTFVGTLNNGLDAAIRGAVVTIFPLNSVGRPLGMVTSTDAHDVAAGASWMFETTTAAEPGVDYVAYPSGSVSFQSTEPEPDLNADSSQSGVDAGG